MCASRTLWEKLYLVCSAAFVLMLLKVKLGAVLSDNRKCKLSSLYCLNYLKSKSLEENDTKNKIFLMKQLYVILSREGLDMIY